MIPAYLFPLVNHLWQSTLFAAGAGLLTLVLSKNRAAVRYWIWLAASVKFLIPFSLLISMGSHVGLPQWARSEAAITGPRISFVLGDVGQPFEPLPSARRPEPAQEQKNSIPAILFGAWICGIAVSAVSWFRQWRRIRAALRSASLLDLQLPVKVMSSPERLEPGVFGIRHPVLLLPDGILEHLTPAQFHTILAHELCHVQRRDNLTAAVHMMVETLFWFYPVLRWIRTRLIDERERACDEEVLKAASEPQIYAEGIVNVCKFYLESPLACVSGVTGSNLKRRIREIMMNRSAQKLNFGKKLLLTAAGMAAVAGPFAIGVINAPQIRAQSQPSASLAFEVASIKQNKSQDFRNMGFAFLPGGRFSAKGVPVYMLIAVAYNVAPGSVRLSGGPKWANSEDGRYDIEATAPKKAIPAELTTKARDAKMRLMLQTLLADRFQLKILHETKELPIYMLTVAKNGPKLQQAKIEEKDCADDPATNNGISCHIVNGGMGRGLHGKAVEIADIIRYAENWADRPIVDKTGLTGLFEIDTEGWSPMRPRPPRPDGQPTAEDLALADPARPTLYMIFEKLGLKMEAQKGPLETFVIDHVERPTEN